MGEKPIGRMLVLAGLLLASLFVGAAYAETGDLRLEINMKHLQTKLGLTWITP